MASQRLVSRALEIGEQLCHPVEELRSAALEDLLALYVTRCNIDDG